MPSVATLKLLAAAALAVLLVWGAQQMEILALRGEVGTLRAENAGLLQRAGTLAATVHRGEVEVAECGRANEHNMGALRLCHARTGDLARETRRLDEALAAARHSAAERLATRDAEDAALAERAPVPVEEANAIARARGAGWLWR
ncbi:MAG: hypothetical protein AB7Q81_24330 [Gammaproteobacteria bacterium]